MPTLGEIVPTQGLFLGLRSPQQNTGPTPAGTVPTPQPPMALPIPEDWVEDTDYLDIRRSVGNLT